MTEPDHTQKDIDQPTVQLRPVSSVFPEQQDDERRNRRLVTSRAFHDYFESIYYWHGVEQPELKSYIERGLNDCPSTVITHLLYAADIKGMNRPDVVAASIPIILDCKPALSFIHALIKGLVHQNRWKLMCEFVCDSASGRLRTYVMSIIASHIRCKNHKCLREMPRQGRVANRIRGYMKLDPASWRKTLSRGCWGSIYNLMSQQKWDTIKYDRLGAYVLAENFRTFMRHDKDRFKAFLSEFPAIAKIVRNIRMSKYKKHYLSQKDIYDTYFVSLEDEKHEHE